MSKRETFKLLIREFHESTLPKTVGRELEIPLGKKIVTLAGPRRAGKTFYFFQTIEKLLKNNVPKDKIVYVNFEDDRILPLKTADLNDLIEAYLELYPANKGKEPYLFFDEIQNIPAWETFVRRVSDKEKAMILITGSSSKLLSKEIATALRGRTLAYRLFPLSFREFLQFKEVRLEKNFEYSAIRYKIKNLFEEYLQFGGYPEIVFEDKSLKQKILAEYFELAIYKDIVERHSVRNVRLLKNLAKFLITNISSVFSISAYHKNTEKEMPVGKETIMEYLSFLEDAGILFLVPLFDYSLKRQNVNPKKAFCIDNGLRNAVAFTFSKDEGKLAENLVFIELKRRQKEVYYWKNKGEVDFVIKNTDNTLEAINVSYSNEINERENKNLLEFKHKFRNTKKLLILTKDLEKKEKTKKHTIEYTPLWKWLLEQQS